MKAGEVLLRGVLEGCVGAEVQPVLREGIGRVLLGSSGMQL